MNLGVDFLSFFFGSGKDRTNIYLKESATADHMIVRLLLLGLLLAASIDSLRHHHFNGMIDDETVRPITHSFTHSRSLIHSLMHAGYERLETATVARVYYKSRSQ